MCSSLGFLAGLVVKTGNEGDVRDAGLIPGWGGAPGGGNGKLLQYPGIVGNPMDRGAQQATTHGVPKSHTSLSVHICAHTCMCVHTHTSLEEAVTARTQTTELCRIMEPLHVCDTAGSFKQRCAFLFAF